MTFKELMLSNFPKADMKNLLVDCCPCNFGHHTIWTKICDKYGCLADCSKCWDSEIIGENMANNIEIMVDSMPLDYYSEKMSKELWTMDISRKYGSILRGKNNE